jgi:hypothetical protein
VPKPAYSAGFIDIIREILEARVGIEPTHKGFADLSLTTWVPRLGVGYILLPCRIVGEVYRRQDFIWSGRPGSNRRHLPWQGSTLPLSYSRSYKIKYNGHVPYGQRAVTYCRSCNPDLSIARAKKCIGLVNGLYLAHMKHRKDCDDKAEAKDRRADAVVASMGARIR